MIRIQVAYPDPRVIGEAQVKSWAGDDLANTQGIDRAPDDISLEEAIAIVNDTGNASVCILEDDQNGYTAPANPEDFYEHEYDSYDPRRLEY